MSTVRPPLRTTTPFSGHLNTSGGCRMSSSQAASSAGSALVANVAAGNGITPIADHQHVNLADPHRVARRNQLVGPRSTGV
jgi:hypothetical protein